MVRTDGVFHLQAVKLESVHAQRTRYLVVVSCTGRHHDEESCLLGIDCNERTTVGLVLKVMADTAITLDGDGSAIYTSFTYNFRNNLYCPKIVRFDAKWLTTLNKFQIDCFHLS